MMNLGNLVRRTAVVGLATLVACSDSPTSPASNATVNPSIGSANAKVTITEFSDFQCPYCASFYNDTWPSIKRDYVDAGKVRVIYRNFPLSFHQNADIAANAAMCANEQNKFWEYRSAMRGNEAGIGLDATSLKQYAVDVKLDTPKFNLCLDAKKYESVIQQDIADGTAAGVSGTPTFFVNGQPVVGAQPYSVFKQTIDAKLAAP